MNLGKTFKTAIFEENPIFVQLIGLCSVLAVTTTVVNSISMGLAVIFVASMSNLVISALRNFIPENIRIPFMIIVIATFVTIVQMLLQAFAKPIYDALGIFLPLIVVNCLILGGTESFAIKNEIIPSFVYGIGSGVGYTLALLLMGIIRETFGNGTILAGTPLEIALPEFLPRIGFLTQPAGAFVLLGYLLAAFTLFLNRKEAR